MNSFICLYKPGGQFVTTAERARYQLIAPDGERPVVRWIKEPGLSIGTMSDTVGLAPLTSRFDTLLAVGIVRLDNRNEVARLSGVHAANQTQTDLDLILHAVAARGPSCLAQIFGDFSLVIWDSTSHTVYAVRDPFGSRNLFHGRREGIVGVCSRSSPLADGDKYDMEFLASFLMAGSRTPTRTPFVGVTAIPAGAVLTYEHDMARTERFWNPRDFAIDDRLTGEAQYEEFRRLFSDAVRSRLTGGHDTWAQLSGGLDSSSIVCMAESLARAGRVTRGVGGTITFIDTLAAPHDSEYSSAVIAEYGVRNEPIVDYWAWKDDGLAPPLTDRPVPLYPFYAQTRRMSELVRRGGGRVLLSGHGSDFYLTGNLFFFADWIAGGHVRTAARELLRWSMAGRVSFWKMAFENAFVPLLPAVVQRVIQDDRGRLPVWVDKRFAESAVMTRSAPPTRLGSIYADTIASFVDALSAGTEHEVVCDAVDVRYPFLDRALIEFALRLPPAMRAQPYARKWVLREAMRGVLPEVVRTRSGKATISSRIAWSLRRERTRIDDLLRDPVLGQLGCIDVDQLRRTLENERGRGSPELTLLMVALSLETWLRVRSGRWTARKQQQYAT